MFFLFFELIGLLKISSGNGFLNNSFVFLRFFKLQKKAFKNKEKIPNLQIRNGEFVVDGQVSGASVQFVPGIVRVLLPGCGNEPQFGGRHFLTSTSIRRAVLQKFSL